jgi:hypothetical protein
MTTTRSLVLGGLGFAALLLSEGSARAQATNRELLEDLQREAPAASRNVTIPSPNTTTPGVRVDDTPSSSGSRALRNLKDEEADRTQKRILEQLK